ncbi:ABC transporter substrate-binding protein [Microbaculum marinisediminis]|uniref:ABC transporter substrate-binding protein n=1 Tax=Microbaculum marinisediminis TaxID=2931392 RepID=A0AAW5R749_9HYPH|nr:ABC transporter substrate-binding protein [Microbaculum sp. A6E488]MCT8974315.1 ABC transporter substrate-binding protein [Microbaculum sp. A6E488]
MNKIRNALSASIVIAAMGIIPNGTSAQGSNSVKIGLILPLSGAGTFEGQLGTEGARTVVDMINEDGGILGGRKVEIVEYDDKSSPEEGSSAARRAMDQDGVDAIVGNMFSPVALAMKEVTRDKILHVAIAPQHPNVTKEGHKWLFRMNETTLMRGANFSKFICENMDLKSVAILAINDDYGRNDAENFEKYFTDCGIEVKSVEFFQKTDTDFTVQVSKIRGIGPDGVYVAANAISQGATIYKQLKQLGYRGTIIASGGNISPKLVELSGSAIEGVFSVSPYVEDPNDALAVRWRDEYAKRFKNETSFVAALTAAGMEVVIKAMDKAGTSTDYDKIAQTIRDNKWDTVIGPVTFDDHGQAYINSYIVQVNDGLITTHSRAN